MGTSLKVRNVGRGQVAFMVYPPVEFPPETPKHKRRKLSRASVRSVVIPSSHVCDLVEVTGLTEEVLRSLPEVQAILKSPNVCEWVDEPEPEDDQLPETDPDAEVDAVDAATDIIDPADAVDPVEDEEPVAEDAPVEGAPVDEEPVAEDAPVEDEEPPHPVHSVDDLSVMTKAELVHVGTALGLELDRSSLKNDLVAEILKAQ